FKSKPRKFSQNDENDQNSETKINVLVPKNGSVKQNKKQSILSNLKVETLSTQQQINERKNRFKNNENLNSQKLNFPDSKFSFYTDKKGNDWGIIKGECTNLEKPYLRLTSKPDPSKIRPLPILKKAFKLFSQKWSKDKNYIKYIEQMKSIRQDLSVFQYKT
ncbi:hypothetical protein MHBO_003748, partial [Bonamia ostreae]